MDEQLTLFKKGAVDEYFLVISPCDEISNPGSGLKTICSKVENHEPIIRVFNSLFPHFNFNPKRLTPHFAIAKTISVTKFDQIKDIPILYDYYRKKFDCDDLTLLKRVKKGSIHRHEFVTEIKF